ncbi:class I SAM-dependent methyltransferase [Rhizobium sp. CNPSo 3464]|uniref:N-6 DNA methylase n=1 Tax=Rhizobium sp. CNPSo 3464 TaxID=3021406 RepID=UPI000DD9B521|nr:class I SAM-dependent methyltransferase [Rhizobium sp. CNPSo 3464]MDK4742657.1 class I SAM-dependent methyltransferase [Rhizobium sp. CNPSo 3464]
MNNCRLNTIVKLFETCRYKHDLYSVFSDWCECAAISMSNAVDLMHFERREARYLEILRNYDRQTIETFAHILAEVTMAMEGAPQDILGETFHALELHNKARGQFFTPYTVCRMMALMVAGGKEEVSRAMERRGFLIAQEPAVGSGAMIVALAEAIRDAGFNYQRHLHVTAVDIDRRAVHMAYIQFSLLHIPATVLVGDSLAMTFHEEWHTLAHVMGGWNAKLCRVEREGKGAPPMSNAVAPKYDRAQSAEPKAPSFDVEKTGQFRLF